MKKNFYACSVGKPGEDYVDENLERIIENKSFILHEDTKQKGVYDNINSGDILLLKYNNSFVAYGEAIGIKKTEDEEWSLRAPVREWYFKNPSNPKQGISTYGIGWNVDAGGSYSTVKLLKSSFGLEKIKEIDASTLIYKSVLRQIENQKRLMSMNEKVELLFYKKQIILQGPPGTGKTRLAKEIAKELTKPKVINADIIKENIYEGLNINSSKNKVVYRIGLFEANGVIVFSESNEPNSVSFKKIIDDYSKETWLNGQIKSNVDSHSAAIAKFIYEVDYYRNNSKLIQFHPAYSYEDFVRGIIAKTNDSGQIEYEVVNKIVADFAQKALKNPLYNFVLIIDEINRANLPAVLGELIYALEYRYDPEKPHGTTVESMYALKENKEDKLGNKTLKLPSNLYIIGTMNTADRSVGHIDYAIRRRFAFVDVLPSDSVIDEVISDNPDLNLKAKKLFQSVAKLFTKEFMASDFEAKDVQLGHSYFLADTEDRLKLKLAYEIKPILYEYVKDGILNESCKPFIEKLDV